MRRALVEDRVRGQEFGVRHRTGQPKRADSHARVAEVVGVVVRGDDARERRAAQRRGEVAFPTARASRASP